MRISVIIPVYNAESFIKDSLSRLEQVLSQRISPFEIIVVNDGSTDSTLERLAEINSPNIRLINLPKNQGKFAAIRKGMLHATGKCKVFTDADLPYELEALSYMEDLINRREFQIVIGDRALSGSEYEQHLSFTRKLSTRIFSHAVRMLVTGGLFDTQCGLKAFRADVADSIFPLLLDHRFAADVELLYIALKYNLELRRIPVRLIRQGPSTVRSVTDAFQMLLTIAGLKLNWIKGKYQSKALFDLGKQFYWIS